MGIWLVSACGDTATSNAPQGHAGTGSGFSGSASQDGAIALDDFPRAYSDAFCRLLARCSPQLIPAGDCLATLIPVIAEQLFPPLKAAVADGTAVYDAAALPNCLEEVATASCDTPASESCFDAVFRGTKNAGEVCTHDAQCADRQCLVSNACPGACGTRAKLGEACTPQNGCEKELFCRQNSDRSRTCAQTAAGGEACGAEVRCRGYNYCYAPAGGDGKCLAAPDLPTIPVDGECEVGLGPRCESGLVCSMQFEDGVSLGRCKAKVAVGAACSFSFPDACPEGQHCHITTGLGVKPASGKCQDNPKLGEECLYNTLYSAPCVLGQVCSELSKVCALAKQLEESCAHGSECASQHCSAAGKCSTQLECEKSVTGAL